MKVLRLLGSLCVVVTMAGSLLAAPPPAKKLTCCEAAAAQKKECTNKCCIAAHKAGKSCVKCNPNKEDLKLIKKEGADQSKAGK